MGKTFPLLLILLGLTTGCDKQVADFVGMRESIGDSGDSAAPFSATVTGSSDSVSDSTLKGSLEPTFSWTAVPGASQYKVSVVDLDGTTIRCAAVTTSSLTYAFSACPLPDKGIYKFHAVPFMNGAWQDVLGLITFAVDGLNLAPRQQEILTGQTLQMTSENGTGPFTYDDGGAGYIAAGTGLVTVPLSAPAATLSLSIADSGTSTNSTTLKVRAFSDITGFPSFQPQQGDYTSPEWIFQTASGAVLTSVWTDPLPWMSHSTTYRSTDKGATWSLKDDTNDIYYGEFTTNGIIQANDGALLNCGNSWDTIAGNFSQMRRSVDDGVTWSTTKSFTLPYCHAIGVSPASHTIIAVEEDGSSNKYSVRSTDNGNTWTTGPALTGLSWKAIVRASPSGTFFIFSGSSLQKSTDDGLSWTQISSLPTNMLIRDAIFLSNGDIVAVGSHTITSGVLTSDRWSIVISSDGGDNWTETDSIIGTSPQYIGAANAVFQAADGAIWALGGTTAWISGPGQQGSSEVIRKSTDGGATWTDVLNNYTAGDFGRKISGGLQLSDGRILIEAQRPSVLTPTGDSVVRILQSLDNGGTWTDLSEIAFRQVYYLEPQGFAANGSGRLIATGQTEDDSLSTDSAFVRTSVDGGTTWQTGLDMNDTTRNSNSGGAAIDSSGNFFATVEQVDWAHTLAGTVTVKKSANGTAWSDFNVWNITAGLDFYVYRLRALSDGSLIMGGSLYNSVSTQTDAFFRKISSAGVETVLTTVPPISGTSWDLQFHDVALDPDGTTLWAAGVESQSSGKTLWVVEKSTDGGTTWSPSHTYQPATGTQRAKALRIEFDSAGAIYVMGSSSDFDAEIYKSADHGATWSSVLSSMVTGFTFGNNLDFAIDSQDRLLIVAPTSPSYTSTYGGSVWLAQSGSLTEVDRYDRTGFYESELRFVRRCGTSVCAAGVTNSSKTEGRRLILRKLSP